MSCCAGNCGCGANCNCANGCGGCKMYPDLSYSEAAGAAETVVLGVAPQKTYFEGSEAVAAAAAAENGCNCGANCTCNPCTC